MVLQAWEWCFVSFDLPLRHQQATHTALCTMAKIMAIQSRPPSTFSLPPPALVSPPHAPTNIEHPLWGPSKRPRRPLGMLTLLVFIFMCALISWVVSLNFCTGILTPATFDI